jgi:hypothetical protein
MLRRHVAALRLALMGADALSATLLFLGVSIFRFGPENWQPYWSDLGVDARAAALVYGAGWVAVLLLFGLYRLRARWSARTEVVDVARAVLVLAVSTFVLLFCPTSVVSSCCCCSPRRSC